MLSRVERYRSVFQQLSIVSFRVWIHACGLHQKEERRLITSHLSRHDFTYNQIFFQSSQPMPEAPKTAAEAPSREEMRNMALPLKTGITDSS